MVLDVWKYLQVLPCASSVLCRDGQTLSICIG